jgi:hypothetical protein
LLKTQESKAPRTAEVARPASKRLKRDPSKPIYKDEVAFELTLDEGYGHCEPLFYASLRFLFPLCAQAPRVRRLFAESRGCSSWRSPSFARRRE